MKKQFLFLILFVAAIVAGTSKSYAQYLTVPDGDGLGTVYCLTPTPLNCAAGTNPELHPVQGENYTYSVTTDATTNTIRWFVVNNVDVTTGGDSLINKLNQILPVTSGYIDAADAAGAYDITGSSFIYSVTNGAAEYNNPTADLTSIEIAWKYFDGVNNQVLLVAYVESDPTCTDNIAVWRIIPEPAFTIDVAVLNDNGDSIAGPTDPVTSECVSPIESAVYDPTAGTLDPDDSPGDLLTVDYGENWIYYVVNGANYFDSWLPEIQLTYDATVPSAYEVEWAYIGDATSTAAANWHAFSGGDLAGGTWTSAAPVIAGGSAATDGSTTNAGEGNVPNAGGECIVVRVRLDWGTDIEHDTSDGTLTFAANGIAYDGVGTSATSLDNYDDRTNFEDLKNNGTNGTDCEPDSFNNDVVDYLITTRPQVEEGTPTQEIKTGEGVN